jgi:hypothetical protein
MANKTARMDLWHKPPAPEVFVPAFAARAAAQLQSAPPPALAQRPTTQKPKTRIKANREQIQPDARQAR